MNNKFFKEMWNTMAAYEEAKAKGEKPSFPYTAGQNEAARCFFFGRNESEDEVTVGNLLWERDIPDFVETLRKGGIKSFILTDHSTALMSMMHGFAKEGCKLEGLCTATEENCFDGKREIPAVKFSL